MLVRMGRPMGCLIWLDRKLALYFGLKVSGVILHGLSHCVPQAKIVRTGYPIKGDDSDGSLHFVPTQFFIHLRSETYQNTFKCSQMNLNQFDTFKRLQKIFQLSKTSTLAHLIELLKFNILDYLKYH